MTDRPRDHATRSVTVGSIYVRSTAMRPSNGAHTKLTQLEYKKRHNQVAGIVDWILWCESKTLQTIWNDLPDERFWNNPQICYELLKRLTACVKARGKRFELYLFASCYFLLASYRAPQCSQCSHCKRCISYSNSVCPSVCLSVTRRYCVKTTSSLI